MSCLGSAIQLIIRLFQPLCVDGNLYREEQFQAGMYGSASPDLLTHPALSLLLTWIVVLCLGAPVCEVQHHLAPVPDVRYKLGICIGTTPFWPKGRRDYECTWRRQVTEKCIFSDAAEPIALVVLRKTSKALCYSVVKG